MIKGYTMPTIPITTITGALQQSQGTFFTSQGQLPQAWEYTPATPVRFGVGASAYRLDKQTLEQLGLDLTRARLPTIIGRTLHFEPNYGVEWWNSGDYINDALYRFEFSAGDFFAWGTDMSTTLGAPDDVGTPEGHIVRYSLGNNPSQNYVRQNGLKEYNVRAVRTGMAVTIRWNNRDDKNIGVLKPFTVTQHWGDTAFMGYREEDHTIHGAEDWQSCFYLIFKGLKIPRIRYTWYYNAPNQPEPWKRVNANLKNGAAPVGTKVPDENQIDYWVIAYEHEHRPIERCFFHHGEYAINCCRWRMFKDMSNDPRTFSDDWLKAMSDCSSVHLEPIVEWIDIDDFNFYEKNRDNNYVSSLIGRDVMNCCYFIKKQEDGVIAKFNLYGSQAHVRVEEPDADIIWKLRRVLNKFTGKSYWHIIPAQTAIDNGDVEFNHATLPKINYNFTQNRQIVDRTYDTVEYGDSAPLEYCTAYLGVYPDTFKYGDDYWIDNSTITYHQEVFGQPYTLDGQEVCTYASGTGFNGDVFQTTKPATWAYPGFCP